MAEDKTTTSNPADALRAKAKRAVNVYQIPEKMRNGVESVGLVELTGQEELQATKRARGDAVALAYELAKQSLAEVNGQAISLADGSADQAWEKMGSKVRQLVLTAYADLHSPPDGAADDFLKSQHVKV